MKDYFKFKEELTEAMAGSGYAVAVKHSKGWKIVFSGNKRDQNAEIKKLEKSGKKLGKDFRGYKTKQPVGNIVESLEEGLFDKKYKAAEQMYYKFIRQGDKPSKALSRAARTVKGVEPKKLQNHLASQKKNQKKVAA